MRVAALLTLLITSALHAAPPPTLPAGLGVNIHFTSPKPGEIEQLAAAGFTLVRMDFSWLSTEKERGKYDWSEYETLLAALEPRHIRALFILDYANPLYDNNRSPDTDEGRKAFATWAAAAVTHFKGRGITWEMYNEPNIAPFWRPRVNHDDYVKLALEVGKAVRAAAPDETFIGPASSKVDLPFLEKCFKAGLLEYFDAVSVHPYRQLAPETVAEEYRQLRQLIARYAPNGKSIPIYSGEWGYSSIWSGFDDARQGNYLPHQWLTNLANDVNLSIWYDWHDDGPDPKEPEHHFGTVTLDYQPKPAYVAAKALIENLRGYRFNKRLFTCPGDEDHVLLFNNGDEAIIAAWTTSPTPRTVRIGDVSIDLDQTTKYVKPPAGEFLRKLLAWERTPLDAPIRAPAEVFGRTITRGQSTRAIDIAFAPDPSIFQRTTAIVGNPVGMTITSPREQRLEIELTNPSGEAFVGALALNDAKPAPVRLEAGEKSRWLTLDAPADVAQFRVAVKLLDEAGALIAAPPVMRFVPIPLDRQTYAVQAEGDEKVQSKEMISINGAPVELQLDYDFDAGWKYARVFSRDEKLNRVEGKPRRLSMLVDGDGSGNLLRMRFVDRTGQTFQPDGPSVDFTGAKFVTFPLDQAAQAHWGGAKDGVIHYPIRIESLLLLDSADRAKTAGHIRVTAPTLVYEDE